jgi:phospholipid-binding lipoprotein MlaA
MFMRNNRRLFVFSVFVLLSFSIVCGGYCGQESFPDFLGDDSTETDYLDDSPEVVISDPLEPMNRVFFEFNDVLYEWVVKPTADGYSWIFPLELRQGFGHFFVNLAMPVRLINSLLQGDMEKTGVVMGRFLINSTVGVWGFADVADEEFDITPRRADFGQTIGKWGVCEGIFFCWPVIGPSNARDSVGLVADTYAHPLPYFIDDTTFLVSYYITTRLNKLSLHPDVYEDLKRYSVDPYIAARQAYYDYRKAIVDNE